MKIKLNFRLNNILLFLLLLFSCMNLFGFSVKAQNSHTSNSYSDETFLDCLQNVGEDIDNSFTDFVDKIKETFSDDIISAHSRGRRVYYKPMYMSPLVRIADKYIGYGYSYGASGKGGSFDCSSFVKHVYNVYQGNNYSLPRSSGEQSRQGRVVRGYLKEGDLLFFGRGGHVSHVAIYAGKDVHNEPLVIHASSSGVRYDSLYTPWLRSTYCKARRLLV